MPKKGKIPARGRRPTLSWISTGTNPSSFGQASYTIFFVASDEFHPFRLTSAPPAVRPSPLVHSPPTCLSFYRHTNFPSSSCITLFMGSLPGTYIVCTVITSYGGFLNTLSFPFPSSRPCSSLLFMLSGFPVLSVVFGASPLKSSFVYVRARWPNKTARYARFDESSSYCSRSTKFTPHYLLAS